MIIIDIFLSIMTKHLRLPLFRCNTWNLRHFSNSLRGGYFALKMLALIYIFSLDNLRIAYFRKTILFNLRRYSLWFSLAMAWNYRGNCLRAHLWWLLLEFVITRFQEISEDCLIIGCFFFIWVFLIFSLESRRLQKSSSFQGWFARSIVMLSRGMARVNRSRSFQKV